MRYIYPKAKPQVSRRTHPVVFIAAISLILFSLAGTASVLGFKPLAELDQPASAAKHECSHKLMGNHDASASDTRSNFDSNMPSIQTNESDDVFDTPIVRA